MKTDALSDAAALACAGIVYERNGFYVRETAQSYEVCRPHMAGHAEVCGSRPKTEPDALAKCKRTVDRLARYPQAATARG